MGVDRNDAIRDLERRARRQRRQLKETLERIEYERGQERVDDLTPEQRRAKVREWTRRIGVIAVAAAVWEWLRQPRNAAVAAVATAGTAALVTLPGGEVRDPPTPPGPLPVVNTDPVQESAPKSPQAAATAIVTPRPMPDPETLRGEGQQVGTGPQQIEQTQPEPTTSFQPTPTPSSTPTPEPPELDDEEEARQLCLGLEDRPVVSLGACIRKLLGLL